MTAEVYMDSGVENLNASVDPLFSEGVLRRVIAQIDVSFSNSMIESWWRSLKHQWLFLHQLDSIATVKRLVAFYVAEHTSGCPTVPSMGRHPTRCTSGMGRGCPTSSLLGGKRLASGGWSTIVNKRATGAPVNTRRTSPHEAYAAFEREFWRAQLHSVSSRRFGAAAALRALAVGVPVDVEGDEVLGEAVDEGDDAGCAGEDVHPVLEGQIRRDDR